MVQLVASVKTHVKAQFDLDNHGKIHLKATFQNDQVIFLEVGIWKPIFFQKETKHSFLQLRLIGCNFFI